MQKADLITKLCEKKMRKQKGEEQAREEAWNESWQTVMEQIQGSADNNSDNTDIDATLARMKIERADLKLKIGSYVPAFPSVTMPAPAKALGPAILSGHIQAELALLSKDMTAGMELLYIKVLKDPSENGGDGVRFGNKLHANFCDLLSIQLPLLGQVRLVKHSMFEGGAVCINAGRVMMGDEPWVVAIYPPAAAVVKESAQCAPAWMVRVLEKKPPKKEEEQKDPLLLDIPLKPTMRLENRNVTINLPEAISKLCEVEQKDLYIHLPLLVPNQAMFTGDDPVKFGPAQKDSKGNMPANIDGYIPVELTRPTGRYQGGGFYKGRGPPRPHGPMGYMC